MTQSDGAARTLELLVRVPPRSAVAIVLRHGERQGIAADTFGADVPLTAQGRDSAHRLGMGLSSRAAGVVKASPLPRCMQTAAAIIAGSGWSANAIPDCLLGDPGPFVTQPDAAGQLFLDIGISTIVKQQLARDEPPAGMRPTSEGVGLVLDQLNAALATPDSTNVFVTHDAVLAVLVGYLYDLPVEDFLWPGYLDGLALWPDSGQLRFLWHGLDQGSHPIGG